MIAKSFSCSTVQRRIWRSYGLPNIMPCVTHHHTCTVEDLMADTSDAITVAKFWAIVIQGLSSIRKEKDRIQITIQIRIQIRIHKQIKPNTIFIYCSYVHAPVSIKRRWNQLEINACLIASFRSNQCGYAEQAQRLKFTAKIDGCISVRQRTKVQSQL